MFPHDALPAQQEPARRIPEEIVLSTPPRYLPDEPLPPYAYRPGEHPHPTRDPRGHMFGDASRWGPSVDPLQWRRCRGFLRGVDLHNACFHWEAHEVWEELWHEAFDSVQAEFFQSLIQATAAALHASMGHDDGARRLAARAAGHLELVAQRRGSWYMGVDVASLLEHLHSVAAHEGSLEHVAMLPLVLGPPPGNAPATLG